MNATSGFVQGTPGELSLGFSLAGLCLAGIGAQLVAGYGMIKGGLLTDKSKTFYRPAFSLLVDDTLQLCLSLYTGIASALQRQLFPDSVYLNLGWVFLIFWHESWWMLILITLNRFVGSWFPAWYPHMFPPRVMNTLVILSWPLSLTTASISQFVILGNGGCCRLMVIPAVFTIGWAHPEGEVNWADWLVEWPGNVSTSVVIIVGYAAIFYRIRETNRQVSRAMVTQESRRRRKRELSLALQFLAISGVFVTAITLFRLFPLTVPEGYTKPYAFIALLIIVNSSLNSIIYLSFNVDIRNSLGLKKGLLFYASKWTTGWRTSGTNVIDLQTIKPFSTYNQRSTA